MKHLLLAVASVASSSSSTITIATISTTSRSRLRLDPRYHRFESLLLSASTAFVSSCSVVNKKHINYSFKNTPPTLRSSMSSLSSAQSSYPCPTLTLRDGTPHPVIGFGTYKVGFVPTSASSSSEAQAQEEGQRSAYDCILDALSTGYRFFECAEYYNNEAEVGRAIATFDIPRSELFLCSKVWTTTIEQGPDAIRAQLFTTLTNLQTDYLDLYLLHWPVPIHHVTAYKVLQTLQHQGYIRNIGLSNYSIEDYQELLGNDITIKPTVNQIEINPFLYRKNTISYFRNEGVVLQSYRSLRNGKVMTHPSLLMLASKYTCTVAQILGRWCIQHDFIYIPKSVNKGRMIENANIFNTNFTISVDDMDILDNMTTDEAIHDFVTLYRKCVNRDTSNDGTMEGVKMNITVD